MEQCLCRQPPFPWLLQKIVLRVHKLLSVPHTAVFMQSGSDVRETVRIADKLNEELVSEQREDLSFVWEVVKSLNGIVECATAEELSKAVDFPISDVRSLPFAVAQTTYTSITLKGSAGQYTLAWWTNGTYAYSMVLLPGIDELGWNSIIEEIRKAVPKPNCVKQPANPA